MGIPGFGEYLRDQRVINVTSPHIVSSVAIDFNAILHPLAGMVFGTSPGDNPGDRYRSDFGLLHTAIRDYLRGVIETFHPRDWLYLAVDGVAPLGKVVNQRKRRIQPPETNPINETIYDSIAITPGTDFMLRLHQVILTVITELQTEMASTLPLTIIYSDHLTPGEGEHKIMDFYRDSAITSGLAARYGGSHILISPDLDLIMLCLIAPLNHILVARTNTQVKSPHTIVYDMVDIDLLRSVLRNNLHNHGDERTVIDDFVLITLLVGNDFLSHHPAFVNVKTTTNYLIDKYNTLGQSLTRDRDIIWNNLLAFFKLLAADEPQMIARLTQRSYRYPPKLALDAVVNGQFYWDTYRTNWYMRALGPRDPYQFNQLLSRLRITNPPSPLDNLDAMIVAYLTTIDWNYRYYQSGVINNYWYYQYDYVPFFVDIIPVLEAIVQFNDSVLVMALPQYGWNDNQPLHPLYQLAAVLPYRAPAVMPSIIRAVMAIDSPVADMYVTGYIKEIEGVEHDHQGIIVLPPLDIIRIIKAINGLSIDEYILITYDPHSPFVYDNSATSSYTTIDVATIPSPSVGGLESNDRQPKRGNRSEWKNLGETSGTPASRPFNPRNPRVLTEKKTYEVPLMAPVIDPDHPPMVPQIDYNQYNIAVTFPYDRESSTGGFRGRSDSGRSERSDRGNRGRGRGSERSDRGNRESSSYRGRGNRGRSERSERGNRSNQGPPKDRPMISIRDLGDL